MEFEDVLHEIYKLLPIDTFIKSLGAGIEPSLLWKLGEAEDIVRRRLRATPGPTFSENVSNAEKFETVDYDYACTCICSVLDITWETLNIGHWSKVPLIHRHLYTAASFVKILATLQSKDALDVPSNINEAKNALECNSKKEKKVEEALKTADMGLLLGAPLPSPHSGLLQNAARILSAALIGKSDQSTSTSKTSEEKSDTREKVIGGVKGREILRLQRPSLEKFRVEHFDPHLPVILTDCIGHWPALTRWPDPDYLRRVAGARLVPVELGSRYTDDEWSQKLMTLTEFIDAYVVGGGGEVGYLAQHPLFDQVPGLLCDIREPEYCCVSDGEEEEEDTDINAWFGPEGTVSPLHYDPKHNLLAQVVGSKRVLLYSPADSAILFPHEDRLLANTARVDPESPDYVRFPRYREAEARECRLQPGEMLYIPPRWWHHVRSLETSFSVSFWWR